MTITTDEIKNAFEKQLGRSYAQKIVKWLEMEPSELIDLAEEISAVRMLVRQLPEALNTAQMEYLLRYDSLLDVVCTAWMFEDDVDYSDELYHIAESVMGSGSPECMQHEGGQTMC